jgi:hypothetical protein
MATTDKRVKSRRRSKIQVTAKAPAGRAYRRQVPLGSSLQESQLSLNANFLARINNISQPW